MHKCISTYAVILIPNLLPHDAMKGKHHSILLAFYAIYSFQSILCSSPYYFLFRTGKQIENKYEEKRYTYTNVHISEYAHYAHNHNWLLSVPSSPSRSFQS